MLVGTLRASVDPDELVLGDLAVMPDWTPYLQKY